MKALKLSLVSLLAFVSCSHAPLKIPICIVDVAHQGADCSDSSMGAAQSFKAWKDIDGDVVLVPSDLEKLLKSCRK